MNVSLRDWIDLLEKNHDKIVTLWTIYLTFVFAISAGIISLGDQITLHGKLLTSIGFTLFAVAHCKELIVRYRTMKIIANEIHALSKSYDFKNVETKNLLSNYMIAPIFFVIIMSAVALLFVLLIINYLPATS